MTASGLRQERAAAQGGYYASGSWYHRPNVKTLRHAPEGKIKKGNLGGCENLVGCSG